MACRVSLGSATDSPGEIVTNEENERAIFQAFVKSRPSFAEEPLVDWFSIDEWYALPENSRPAPPNENRPDVICITASTQKIGVELSSWLHETETAASKRRQRIENAIRQAIGTQPPNSCKHISIVFLRPRFTTHLTTTDSVEIKDQLFQLIESVDDRWPHERFWQTRQGYHCRDLTAYPALAKHFEEVLFHSQQHREAWPVGCDWIIFPSPVSSFDEWTMIRPLLHILEKKVQKYERFSFEAVGVDALYLLVHYDQALLHNSPVEDLQKAAKYAKTVVRNNKGAFEKLFLFWAMEPPHDRVIQLG